MIEVCNYYKMNTNCKEIWEVYCRNHYNGKGRNFRPLGEIGNLVGYAIKKGNKFEVASVLNYHFEKDMNKNKCGSCNNLRLKNTKTGEVISPNNKNIEKKASLFVFLRITG